MVFLRKAPSIFNILEKNQARGFEHIHLAKSLYRTGMQGG